MRLKCDNRILVKDQPKTILTNGCTAADVTITVASNDGFTNGDYLLLGRIGEQKTEIVKINGAITHGTSLTITAAVFNHDIDTPVVKISYNQVRFYHGTTAVAADSTALATAQDIDPTEEFSYYEDATYTSGYGFVRFYNSTSANYSAFSTAINYSYKTGYSPKMLRSIRKKVRRLLGETDPQNSNYTDEEIDEEINLQQKEISHDRMWSFLQKTKSFSSVEDQYEYDLASNVFALFEAMFDTQPLVVVNKSRMNMLRWDTDVTGDPTHIAMWSKKALIYPYPSSSADTTTLGAAISTTTVTTITVASTADFPTQGRIIVDSEVISYTGKTSTTFTGCVRGEEGTTAATHSNGATVTERDFVYNFQEDPDDLIDETDETAIPDPSIIAYGATAELTGESGLQDRMFGKKERAMKQLRKVDEPKIKGAFGVVRDSRSMNRDFGGLKDQNNYPQNLTGA